MWVKMNNKRGKLIILSGPSGVGKDTMFRRLLASGAKVKKAITATTREKRPHEREGVNYYFKTPAEFDKLIEEDALLEWTTYCGHRYGTLKKVVEKGLQRGDKLILVIEIEGAFNIKRQFPDAFMVFIKPPNIEALIERWGKRGTENAEELAARLKRAEYEMQQMGKYDFVIENDNLDIAVEQLKERLEQI